MTVEEFLNVAAEVKTALAALPSAERPPDTPVREIFAARAALLEPLRRVEKLLTDALAKFPLHPYLLDWRAEVRMRMFDANLQHVGADGARDDLEAAIKVAPDYHVAHLRYADLMYVQFNQPEIAAGLFARALEKMEPVICSCVAGQAEALFDENQVAAAEALLAKWELVYPASERLHEAARHLQLRPQSVS